MEQRDAARRAFEDAVSLAPAAEVWKVRNEFAEELRSAGDVTGALEQFRASLSMRPDQSRTRAEIIATYLVLGRYADARLAADSAVALRLPSAMFVRLRDVADSAARAGAPPGSVRIGVVESGPPQR
jgi:hypothetical protein